jgi:hypothetical protein
MCTTRELVAQNLSVLRKMAAFAGISSTSTSEEGEDTAGARGRKLIEQVTALFGCFGWLLQGACFEKLFCLRFWALSASEKTGCAQTAGPIGRNLGNWGTLGIVARFVAGYTGGVCWLAIQSSCC